MRGGACAAPASLSTDGAECPCSSSSISLVGQLPSSSPHGNLATKRTLSMSVRGVALRLAMGRVGSAGIDLNAKAPDALGLGSQYVLLAQLRRERVRPLRDRNRAPMPGRRPLSPTGRRRPVAKGSALPCVLLHEDTLMFNFFLNGSGARGTHQGVWARAIETLRRGEGGSSESETRRDKRRRQQQQQRRLHEWK